MSTAQVLLIALLVIYAVPYLVWRVLDTEQFAPLVVVQILTGIALGPGVLGHASPSYYAFVFRPEVVQALNGIAWWAVMLFVLLAGIELDLRDAWAHRRDSAITAALALGCPLVLGAAVAAGALAMPGWIGPRGHAWQFVLGVGMACAVTALPILVLLMDKVALLRTPLGQRVLRYASVDDVAIWGVLALILADLARVGRQAMFIAAFGAAAYGFRRIMNRLSESDRWYVALIWLAACALAADWCGLHFMVGAFLAGATLDAAWFDRSRTDLLRSHVLLTVMPVFFLSTGLRTHWEVQGPQILLLAAALLVASIAGKLAGVAIAGRLLGWRRGESAVVGWLLQTKALIMIIFANILLDRQILTAATFTALVLMAIASTMLTVPMVNLRLPRIRA